MRDAGILIVDDEPRMLESTRLLLAAHDFASETASNAAEALQLIQSRKPEVILLDVMLGLDSGFEVLDQAAIISPGSLVIMITGNASIQSAVRALRQGAYSYLSKPYEPEELISTVQNALTQKRLEDEKKRVAAALRASENRFRGLVESLTIGIVIMRGGRIVYTNPSAADILGRTEQAPEPEDFKYLHPEDAGRVKTIYRECLKGNFPEGDFEFRIRNQFAPESYQPMYRWLKCRAGSLEYGGEPALLVHMTDVTRARENERMLEIKSKMDSLGRVAAGIAHEIRNPLTGINSYLYTLRELTADTRLGHDERDHLGLIMDSMQAASNKIEGVIKRVLDFARPHPPQQAAVDLNQVVDETLKLTATTLRKRGVSVTRELSDPLPPCRADQRLIEQVLLNLTDNAAKSMMETKEEKTILVSTSVRKNKLILTVSDSGPGIPAERRAQIFEPFFTTRADGSGIGLCMAQRIVMDHGGAIQVDTSPLGGAEFRIELPIMEQV